MKKCYVHIGPKQSKDLECYLVDKDLILSTNARQLGILFSGVNYVVNNIYRHPSLLRTFGFCVDSTYDSYLPSISGINALI